jgi:hypothetical protein
MSTSGTATFNLDIADLMEEAFERAGRRLRGGYDYRMGRRALDIMLQEWTNLGLNMWQVQPGTIALVANTASYTLPADTIDLIEAMYRTNAGDATQQVDIYMNRISVSDYAAIPNKLNTGSEAYQYYVDRQAAAPVVYVWPVPDGTISAVLAYYRLRRIQDSGTPASNTMDIPSRFIPPMAAGLAYYVAMKIPELMPRLPMLQQEYQRQLKLAMDEDRDRASVRWTPFVDFGAYGP